MQSRTRWRSTDVWRTLTLPLLCMCTSPGADSFADLALITSMLREARRYYTLGMITRRTFDWRIDWIVRKELQPHELGIRILECPPGAPGFEIQSAERKIFIEIKAGEDASLTDSESSY